MMLNVTANKALPLTVSSCRPVGITVADPDSPGCLIITATVVAAAADATPQKLTVDPGSDANECINSQTRDHAQVCTSLAQVVAGYSVCEVAGDCSLK